MIASCRPVNSSSGESSGGLHSYRAAVENIEGLESFRLRAFLINRADLGRYETIGKSPIGNDRIVRNNEAVNCGSFTRVFHFTFYDALNRSV